MAKVQLLGGKPLIVGGKVALSSACCCATVATCWDPVNFNYTVNWLNNFFGTVSISGTATGNPDCPPDPPDPCCPVSDTPFGFSGHVSGNAGHTGCDNSNGQQIFWDSTSCQCPLDLPPTFCTLGSCTIFATLDIDTSPPDFHDWLWRITAHGSAQVSCAGTPAGCLASTSTSWFRIYDPGAIVPNGNFNFGWSGGGCTFTLNFDISP